MKNMVRILGVLGVMACAGLINSVSAQQKNVIKEVKINSNDGFSELRNLLVQNFDFTNPNLTEGEINSEVKFEVAENGKINKVQVNGDCKYVSEELKDVMNDLVYKFDNPQRLSQVYILPIKVFVASR